LETKVIPAPFVQVPLDALEDRLLGSVDVEKSITTGKTIFQPGLLAAAHRGVLYIDDINLLDESISNILLEALSSGWVNVERDGFSVRHPFHPVLIATCNPEEAELRKHLVDRVGIYLSADAVQLNETERIEAVTRVSQFAKHPQDFNHEYAVQKQSLRMSIGYARDCLKGLKLTNEQIKYLCESAIRAGVEGHRGEIFAAQVAIANAALNGRKQVTADDLKMGVKFCIVPRGLKIVEPEPESEDEEELPPSVPMVMTEEELQEEIEIKENDDLDEDECEEVEGEITGAPPVPEEIMIDPEGVILDPELLEFAYKSKSGNSGSRGKIFSDRGRYIKPIFPKEGKVGKVAVDATLRTAAPYQLRRQTRELDKGNEAKKKKKLFIESSDIREKKMARKAGSLVVFVVDASGSMSVNRMNAAKGAALNLLTEAYQSRDMISLVNFQADAAQVILPPTKSITMAKNRLEKMPCGGGSPLAHALNLASQVGLTAQKTRNVGDVLVVLISDGRANVRLATSLAASQQDNTERHEGRPKTVEDFKRELREELREQNAKRQHQKPNRRKGRGQKKHNHFSGKKQRWKESVQTVDDEQDYALPDIKESANYMLDRRAIKEEVLDSAKVLGSLHGFQLLVLDTESKLLKSGEAKEIAEAAQGRYHYVPKQSKAAIKQIATQVIKEVRAR